MASPQTVRVDKQGRLVLPRDLRDSVLDDVPGHVRLERTADGLLLTPAHGNASLATGDDGLPVLDVDRPVTNAEVLDAIDEDRRHR